MLISHPSNPPHTRGGTPPPSRIPPYYMSECQVRGYNPLNNGNKIFGKIMSPIPKGTEVICFPITRPPISIRGYILKKKFLEKNRKRGYVFFVGY